MIEFIMRQSTKDLTKVHVCVKHNEDIVAGCFVSSVEANRLADFFSLGMVYGSVSEGVKLVTEEEA